VNRGRCGATLVRPREGDGGDATCERKDCPSTLETGAGDFFPYGTYIKREESNLMVGPLGLEPRTDGLKVSEPYLIVQPTDSKCRRHVGKMSSLQPRRFAQARKFAK
jgi:hypothetical protein